MLNRKLGKDYSYVIPRNRASDYTISISYVIFTNSNRSVFATGEKLNTARNYHVASLVEIDYLVTENSKVDYIKQHWPSYTYQVL